METITFYSYKGGTGRTLAVANVAKYLSRFGKRIFALDFDLEAPGLMYKFGLSQARSPWNVGQGVVDYILFFQSERKLPASLADYVVDLTDPSISGSLHAMPAGSSPSPDYWRNLAQINWHELFYSEAPKGVALFLDLKKWIEQEYSPDFLLIDARTGISEIGGAATTILADKVICLLLCNRENLDGAREVLRSVRRAKRAPGQPPIEILPVLCRIPQMEKAEFEESKKVETLSFLNAPCEEDLSCTLDLREVFLLHSEPELQVKESLRLGGEASPDASPLLRDYIRLVTRIIPPQAILPNLNSLIEDARKAIWENPDAVQHNLEELAHITRHPNAWHALLEYYRLRQSDRKKTASAAFEFWQIKKDSSDPIDPLLWDIVRETFDEVVQWREGPFGKGHLPFVEAVWRAAGANEKKIALDLAESYDNFGQRRQACVVLSDLLKSNVKDEKVVYRLLRQLRRAEDYERAISLIEEYRNSLSWTGGLLEECARLSLETKQPDLIKKIPDLNIENLAAQQPLIAARLAHAMGNTEEAKRILRAALPAVLAKRQLRPNDIQEFDSAFRETGIGREFSQILREQLGPDADRYLDRIRHESPFFSL